MHPLLANPPLFLDYEASSLMADSYPIEVGHSDLDLPEPTSILIRPHVSWRSRFWDVRSEAVHGIPQILLDAEGIDTEEVCKRLSAAAHGRNVVSDFPRVERAWSKCLYDTLGLEVPFLVHSFEEYLWHRAEAEDVDPGEAFFVLHAHAHHFKTIHRAGPDSFRMAEVVRAVVDRGFRDALFGRKDYGRNWTADMENLR